MGHLTKLIAAAALAGVDTMIGEAEDEDAKTRAFDELMEGKWEGIRARQLAVGHQMRDADGNLIEVSSVVDGGDDHVVVTAAAGFGMRIPSNAVVLVLPTA